MFGLMKGCSCTLDGAERQAWRGYFCGLCLAIKENHGQMARIATNHDAALLAVLCDAQDPAPAAWRTSYCPLRRPYKATVADPQTPGTAFAAAMALLMAATRIEDHAADGEQFWGSHPRLAARVSGRWQRAACRSAAETSFNAANIALQTRRQAALERIPGQDFFFYAQPTELATAAAFQHTAVLANQPGNIPDLFQAGRLFGRIMVLLDSYQDLAADQANGRFNALAASCGADVSKRQATQQFKEAFAGLQRHVQELTLPNPQLIRKLLRQQLQHKAQQILNGTGGAAHAKGGTREHQSDAALTAVMGSKIDGDRDSEGWPDAAGDEMPDTEWEGQEDRSVGDSTADWCYWGGGGWGPNCGGDDCDCDGDGDCDMGDCDCGGLDCGDLDCGALDCGDVDCGGLDCG